MKILRSRAMTIYSEYPNGVHKGLYRVSGQLSLEAKLVESRREVVKSDESSLSTYVD